ncbi:MAG: hypothetical protein Q7S87_00835 [Agitococcus sp.]|nr:hypothetical protein [Agitococcus sp.]
MLTTYHQQLKSYLANTAESSVTEPPLFPNEVSVQLFNLIIDYSIGFKFPPIAEVVEASYWDNCWKVYSAEWSRPQDKGLAVRCALLEAVLGWQKRDPSIKV